MGASSSLTAVMGPSLTMTTSNFSRYSSFLSSILSLRKPILRTCCLLGRPSAMRRSPRLSPRRMTLDLSLTSSRFCPSRATAPLFMMWMVLFSNPTSFPSSSNFILFEMIGSPSSPSRCLKISSSTSAIPAEKTRMGTSRSLSWARSSGTPSLNLKCPALTQAAMSFLVTSCSTMSLWVVSHHSDMAANLESQSRFGSTSMG
mmetsp:Transcript_22108/g.72802  ORF Transcript_22108/g.72802 Transcript_22108/m.72802 type:complete len:202 (+) Transcript_22108:165-770(+)